ncbi:MotA/TolQ/ExbB proton channel family protein [Clostridium grantii]|uniref:MotA/TolQ/ExbB proton channel family protein n=1 Tax=Clostridium grantii DSM 8605 TaxID=1121316 RepID=A0A1M5Y1X5_9CLOT|nr:MotA/TolQ/ExbB proton channel family protein [Clostridium grantii]SHI05966.1 MotA/TolQ/ExbB proton channel family protein [Clostridium grantii DSM 8605]
MPNIASSLGVLGTFIGIAIGLYNFNANDIDSSVPQLLDGMKTAFYTSIAGMLASIIMKSFEMHRIRAELSKEDSVNYEDSIEVAKIMIDVIKELNKNILENQSFMSDRFEKMDENSNRNQEKIINELKISNMDTSRKQDELINEFKTFASNMAELNSQSLIDALQEVIKDFNNKISEQFGENFKELNKAVGALLIWQDNYKEHIEITINQLEVTANSMDKV